MPPQPRHPMSLEEHVEISGEAWRESSYYQEAEAWTFLFWEHAHPFRPLFDLLDLHRTCELACGHGRHTEQLIERGLAAHSERITLMDIHPANLEASRQRLAGRMDGLVFERSDGYSFRPLAIDSLTSIFCYDAMVHFQPELVESYIRDALRVLQPGGRALFHHSNLASSEHDHYGQNPHARNVMAYDNFRHCAESFGFRILDSQPIAWGGIPELDRITLLEKPNP